MDNYAPSSAEPVDSTEQADFVTALARGLAVIRAFGADAPRMMLTDIARRVDLPRATVRRSLITLKTLGYIENDGRYFALTPRVLALGHSYLSSTPLPRAAQPFLDRLSDQIHDPCSVSILDDDEVLVLARAAPKRLISLANSVGTRLPAYCTGSGRMLLASLSEDAFDAFLARIKPRRFTANTHVEPDDIRLLVQEARELGYAFSNGEVENSVRSIAVTLRNAQGRPIAVLGAASYMERIGPTEMIERFLPLMRRTAQDLRPALI
jgi:IclR family pca regulon transcriptional regulator